MRPGLGPQERSDACSAPRGGKTTAHPRPQSANPLRVQKQRAELLEALGGLLPGQVWGHFPACTLKMPAMESVRLDVLDTKRNSEKPKPKARIPPRRRLPSTRRSSPVSWKRKIFSEVDKWRPKSNRERAGGWGLCSPAGPIQWLLGLFSMAWWEWGMQPADHLTLEKERGL